MTTPTAADFKTQFVRDFPYGKRRNQVQDGDLNLAILKASTVFNSSLWANDAEAAMAWLYAAAHFLVLQARDMGGFSYGAGKGLASRGGGAVVSKTVGPVTVNYQLAERFSNSRTLSGFLQTGYGQQYLQMVAPKLVGGMVVVQGSGIPPDPVI